MTNQQKVNQQIKFIRKVTGRLEYLVREEEIFLTEKEIHEFIDKNSLDILKFKNENTWMNLSEDIQDFIKAAWKSKHIY